MPQSKPKGQPLPQHLRTRLARLVSTRGEIAAADHLGCSRGTLSRALAGMTIYKGTAALIAAKLGKATRRTEKTP